MAGMYGADIAQLRTLAAQFDRAADQLDSHRVSVGGAIRVSAWQGPDAGAFRHQWDSAHAGRMAAAAGSLRTNAQLLRANAEDQERTSAVEGGAGNARNGRGAVHAARSTPTADDGTVVIYDEDGNPIGVRREWADKYGGSWTTVSRGVSGLHADTDVDGGFDNGRLEGSAHASVQAGFEAEESAEYTNGLLSAGASYRGFSGAEAEAAASGGIGLDGAEAQVRAGAFAGSELSGSAALEVSGVRAGVDAGITAGVGATASAAGELSYDEVRLEVELGLSLGVGLRFKPSVSVSPKRIVDGIVSVFGVGR